jgi:hypothetical protein
MKQPTRQLRHNSLARSRHLLTAASWRVVRFQPTVAHATLVPPQLPFPVARKPVINHNQIVLREDGAVKSLVADGLGR